MYNAQFSGRIPVLGYRLVYAPKRSDNIVLEQKDFSATSSVYSSEIPPNKIFTGHNIENSLSTKSCDFSYGYNACVASAHISKNATPELKAQLIKHLENSVIDQIKKYNKNYLELNLVFPCNSEYL